jgi:hypothetical protein
MEQVLARVYNACIRNSMRYNRTQAFSLIQPHRIKHPSS